MDLRPFVRDIRDFPVPGIVFKDITPLLGDAAAFASSVDQLAAPFVGQVDRVACVDARGFLFGAGVALRLGLGLVPLRKPGKLPFATLTQEYDLEYGTNQLAIHTDGVGKGERVLLVDDVLATGGTATAAVSLLREAGAAVVAAAFVIELGFLGGRAKLPAELDVHAVIAYP